MAYDEQLAERVRILLKGKKEVSEKKMFGGLSFLVDGKMFCGVLKDDLVVRVDPTDSEKLVKQPHVRYMDFTGKPMKGFLYISADGYNTDSKLSGWIDRSLRFVSALIGRKKMNREGKVE